MLLASLVAASGLLRLAAGEAAHQNATVDACQGELRNLQRRVAQLERQLEEGHEAFLRDGVDEPGSQTFYVHAFSALACVCLAGLAAGLTMGMVSIEPMGMQIILNTSEKDMLAENDKLKLREDKAAAARILPVIHNHHRLLVTLLLMNSLAFECLPLFLDRLVPSWLAVLISVSLVLVFGEILPSAIFTGRNQLRIAAKFAPLVGGLQIILAPITWSMAFVLDRLLGEDHKGRYNFAELRAIVDLHATLHSEGPSAAIFKCVDDKGLGIITTEKPHHFTNETAIRFTSVGGPLGSAPSHPAISTKLEADYQLYYALPCEPLVGRGKAYTFRLFLSEERDEKSAITFEKGELKSGAFLVQERDEIKIMHGVMKLTHMSAADSYLPLSETYMLEQNQLLTKDLLHEILEFGHSRIPVYSDSQHNIRGFILTKKMIVITPDSGKQVLDIEISPMVLVPPDIPMLDLLNLFQSERCHIALLTSHPDRVRQAWRDNKMIPPDVYLMGIITLEDVIEKLIQEEIYDEHDAKAPGRSIKSRTSPMLISSRQQTAATLPIILGAVAAANSRAPKVTSGCCSPMCETNPSTASL